MKHFLATSKGKLIFAGVALAAAVGIGVFFHESDHVNESEVVEGLKGRTYVVHCSSCNQDSEMSVSDFQAALKEFRRLDAAGLKCPKCGAPNAWQSGYNIVGFNPDSLKGMDLSTRDLVEAAIKDADLDVDRAREDLKSAEHSRDAAKIEAAEERLRTANAKVQYLNDLWDKRTMEETASGG
ncbi:MAG: hypothetical protein KF841_12390 [Phycisphaerae bacterium]|nr:hypothetical protein [Phycisphaerae bacterium]